MARRVNYRTICCRTKENININFMVSTLAVNQENWGLPLLSYVRHECEAAACVDN